MWQVSVTTCDMCDYMGKVWPCYNSDNVTSLTICDNRDQVWQLWLCVSIVNMCDNGDRVWPLVTLMTTYVASVITCDKCDHVWHGWPYVKDVTTATNMPVCDMCGYRLHIWSSWTYGHHGYLDIYLVIIDIWTFVHHGHIAAAISSRTLCNFCFEQNLM